MLTDDDHSDILRALGFHGLDASHDVVSGADSDARGRVYVDRHIPAESPTLRTASGMPVPLRLDLALHELAEARGMREGMSYAKAHEKRGIPAERVLANALGIPYRAEQEEIAGYLSHVEHERATNAPRGALHVDPRAAIKR